MWLKKMLGKPPPPPVPYPDKPNQNKPDFNKEIEDQVDGQSQSTLIDQTPQTRYQNLEKIIHDSMLKIPMIAIHQSQSIFVFESNLIMGRKLNNDDDWNQLDLMVSDRQMIITPNILQQLGKSTLNYFALSFSHIEKCELITSKKQQTRLQLVLKDNRQVQFKCVIGDIMVKIHEIIKKFAFPNGINKFYAFRYFRFNKEIQQIYEGWKAYDIQKQFSRQGLGIDDGSKFLYKWVQNRNGQISKTYPERLVIPSKMSIQNLKKCASFRTKQRFPALTFAYQYKPNKFSTIFRCSQNKVGVLNSRSKEDEQMMIYIGDPQSETLQVNYKANCKIYDARGYYAALGNMFAGKGYQKQQNYKNCQIQWLNIPNIHAVRDSYNQMFNQKDTNSNYFLNIADSGWYQYLSLILAGSKSISVNLMQGLNVVVHCSDGWDRTSQLCSIAQILLDSYYRTIQDWRHFGHKFRQRTGQYRSTDYHPHQRSQIFIQFLDCIYQIMNQFPLSFQFNQRLLLFLAENVDSNVYGTFMTNNIQQAKKLKIQNQTLSIWSAIRQNKQIYKNPFYKSQLHEFSLNVGTQPKHMKVWRQYFFGDGTTQNTAYHMMRQSLQINKTMRNQYYSNQDMIQKLKQQLKELQKC